MQPFTVSNFGVETHAKLASDIEGLKHVRVVSLSILLIKILSQSGRCAQAMAHTNRKTDFEFCIYYILLIV